MLDAGGRRGGMEEKGPIPETISGNLKRGPPRSGEGLLRNPKFRRRKLGQRTPRRAKLHQELADTGSEQMRSDPPKNAKPEDRGTRQGGGRRRTGGLGGGGIRLGWLSPGGKGPNQKRTETWLVLFWTFQEGRCNHQAKKTYWGGAFEWGRVINNERSEGSI